MSTTKIRVYELARETGLDNKEVLRRLEELDIDASTHSSSVTAGEAQRFRESLGKSEEQKRREEEERRRREQEELERYRKMAEEVTAGKTDDGKKAKAVLPPHLREEQDESGEEPDEADERVAEPQTGASIAPADTPEAQAATAAPEAEAEAETEGEAEEETATADEQPEPEGTVEAPAAGAGDGQAAAAADTEAGGAPKRMPGAPPPTHQKGDVPLRPQLRKEPSEGEEPPPTVTGEGPTPRRRHTSNLPKEGSGKRSIPKPIRKAPPRPERPSSKGGKKPDKEDAGAAQPAAKGDSPDTSGARPGENKPRSGGPRRHEKTTPEEREMQRRPRRRDVPLAEQVRVDRVNVLSGVTVGELADELDVPGAALVKQLFEMGEMATVQQTLPDDTVEILGAELGFDVYFMSQAEAEFGVEEPEEEDLQPRPPVVTVMGHVDHGKTQLLDAIRETDVVAGEAGGITQHIGAYQIQRGDTPITFIDTPGHEAFTAMRARGADVTDLVILVVAADDGVMPQTVEAVNHAKAAGVPIVVAINKMDLEGADPDKVKGQLTEHELVAEEYGGDTLMVPVSALERTGLDELLETVALQAELLELRANPDKQARGRVIEAHLDKGRGPTATLLVQDGTLERGEVLVAGATDGKVRAMFDEAGREVERAGPAKPVQVLGLDDVPEAGDQFRIVDEERFARDVAERRAERERRKELAQQRRPATLEELTEEVKEGEKAQLNVIIKADVSGSAEALQDALNNMEYEEVRVDVVHKGVGAVTEGDVRLAETSDAIIIGFNVRPGAKARDEIERAGVEVRTYSIIYEVLEDIERALKGLLGPAFEERTIGEVEVRELFKVPDVGFVFGSYVTDGVVRRDARVRVLRDGVIVAEDRVESLKRFEDDVNEVSEGYECGIGLGDFQDVKTGDRFEVFESVEVERDVTPV